VVGYIAAAFVTLVVGYAGARLRQQYPPLPVCNCSIHDITRLGAAHADDCPAATHND
jgi:hypothetical protein